MYRGDPKFFGMREFLYSLLVEVIIISSLQGTDQRHIDK